MINKQFQSVFTQEDKSTIPECSGKRLPDISDLNITIPGVTKLLKDLQVGKSSGPDQIPNRLLKEAASELAPVVHALFMQSLNSGKLPKDWRNANITPIYKKGNKHLAENYRPVSLTCVCCKLMEHIICKHILTHSEKHSLITNLQHGFRNGLSCETQLMVTMHDLLQAYDDKHQVDVTILDFSKAFDTVPHERLLAKLEHSGIRGPILNWIREFLTNRQQKVVVSGESSTPVHVDSGVPQGTVLGPLLFNLFINDMPSHVKSQMRLFADDALLYRRIDSANDQKILQEDLSALQHWADTWGMRFNPKKCYVMRIARSSKPLTKIYTLMNHPLEQVQNSKYLGVLISDNLKWGPHVNQVCQKANRLIGFLRRNLKYCPKVLKDTAYKSLVRSNLEYCSSIWDPHFEKDINQLDRVQRRGARFVRKDYSRESSVSNMIKDLRWDSLKQRRKEARLSLLYKVVNRAVCVDPEQYLKAGYSRTRSCNKSKFQQIPSKTPAYNNSFFVRSIPEWNALPASVVDSEDTATFRARLRRHYSD